MWKRQGQASSHWNKQAISQCQWTFKLHVSPAQVFQTFKIVQNIWANFLWSQPCVGGPGQGYRNCFLPFDGMDKRLLVPKSAAAGKAHAETQRTISLALLSSNACLMGLSADTCDKQGTMQKSWWSGRNWRSIYCNYVASLLQCAHIQLTGCCTIYYWNLCRSKSPLSCAKRMRLRQPTNAWSRPGSHIRVWCPHREQRKSLAGVAKQCFIVVKQQTAMAPWGFFFCKWLQKPAAQFEPADGNLPGPDYSTDSRIDSSTLILIQAGGHSHNISNCAHVCLFKSCRGML